MPLFATATRETKLHIFSDSAKGFKTCIIVVDSPSTSNCAGAMRGWAVKVKNQTSLSWQVNTRGLLVQADVLKH